VVFVHELQTVDKEAEFVGFEVFLLFLASKVKLFLNKVQSVLLLSLNIVGKETEIGHHLKIVHLVLFFRLTTQHELHKDLLRLLELFL